jgi:hypothetical protein
MERFRDILILLLKGVLGLLLVALVALGILLEACSRRLPDFLEKRLEDALCSDILCARFDSASFSLRDGLTLRQLRIYARGMIGPPLLAVGEARATVALRIGASAGDCLDAIHLRGLDFSTMPDLETLGPLLSGRRGKDGKSALDAFTRPVDVTVEDLDLLGIPVQELTARVSAHDHALAFESLSLRWPGSTGGVEHASGMARVGLSDGSYRLVLDGRATPASLYPLFHALGFNGVVRVCSWFSDFHRPPVARFDLVRSGKGTPVALRLFLRGANFRYRDIPIENAEALVTLAEDGRKGHVAVSNLRVKHATGSVTGDLGMDFDTDILHLDLDSSVEESAVVRGSGVNTNLAGKILGAVACETPPSMVVSGQVAFAGNKPPEILLRGRVRSGPFTVVDIPFAAGEGDFLLTERSLDLPGVRVSAFGGTVTGDVSLAKSPGPTTNGEWRVNLRGVSKGTSFGGFCQDVFDMTNHYGGILSAAFDLSIPLATNTFPTGTGSVVVRDGMIVRIPLFTGFTDYLADNIPGVETLVTQSDMKLDFVCTNGQFRTDNLLVEGGFFSLRAAGAYTHRDRKVDFLARARLFREKTLVGKVVRVVAFPFSKLLEFRAHGTLGAPKWEYIGLTDRIWDLLGPAGELLPEDAGGN